MPSANRPEAALPAGTVLQNGKYTIGRVLGQGGFGITYLGSWPALNKAVAIKEFYPPGATRVGLNVVPPISMNAQTYGEGRERFMDEGRNLARFRHPGIVRVYDIFPENGTAYLVMEDLSGETLEALRLQRGGRMAEAEVLPLIRQVAEALSEIHAAGLLHRDIKPENIIIADGNHPVLIDFGSAREFVADRTISQTAVLTQGYAPLEQYAGAARRGPYTDIYALGATFYHLLTGQLPPAATDRVAGVDLLAPRTLNPAISETTERTILRALEMDVNRRPPSMTAFLDLLAGKDEQQTQALSQTTATPNGWAADRHRVPTAPNTAASYLQRTGRPLPPGMPPGFPDRIVFLVEELALYQTIDLSAFHCPVCRIGVLSDPATGRMDRCPVCRQPALVDCIPHRDRCPICRRGNLATIRVTDNGFTCPLCLQGRAVERQIGRRRWFQPRIQAECGHCGAVFRKLAFGDRFALESVPPTQPDRTLDYLYSTFSRLHWQAFSGRPVMQRHCPDCGAQFDQGAEPHLWRLAVAPTAPATPVPTGSLDLLSWARLAHGLRLNDPTHMCGHCGAELDEERGDIYRLRGARLDPYGVAGRYRGQVHDAPSWSRLAAGKRTPQAGLFCTECTAEFSLQQAPPQPAGVGDPVERMWRLEAFEASRDRHGVGMRWHGQTLSENDWRRLATGRLRLADEQARREELRAAVEGLIMQGDLTIPEAVGGFPGTVVPGEQPRLVFQAERLVGEQVDDRGHLWITTRRVLFDGISNRLDVPVDVLKRVEASSGELLYLERADRGKPLVYHLIPAQTEIALPGIRLPYRLGAAEAAKVIRALR